MDYRVYRRKADLDSTGFMEIGPGKYSGKHWQDSFLFVWEDAFGMAEGIVAKHFPAYAHFAMNDIPKDIGEKVTAEWRDVADRMKYMHLEQIHAALNLDASYHQRLDIEVLSHKVEIANMLRAVADGCDEFYKQEEWVCILGM
jgi:hypothetical protein